MGTPTAVSQLSAPSPVTDISFYIPCFRRLVKTNAACTSPEVKGRKLPRQLSTKIKKAGGEGAYSPVLCVDRLSAKHLQGAGVPFDTLPTDNDKSTPQTPEVKERKIPRQLAIDNPFPPTGRASLGSERWAVARRVRDLSSQFRE